MRRDHVDSSRRSRPCGTISSGHAERSSSGRDTLPSSTLPSGPWAREPQTRRSTALGGLGELRHGVTVDARSARSRRRGTAPATASAISRAQALAPAVEQVARRSRSGVISDSRGTPRWATPISRRPAPLQRASAAAPRSASRPSGRVRERDADPLEPAIGVGGSRAARSRLGTPRRAGIARPWTAQARGPRRRAATGPTTIRPVSSRAAAWCSVRSVAPATTCAATSSFPRSTSCRRASASGSSPVPSCDTASRVSRAPVAQARVWPSSIASAAIASGSMATTMRWVMCRRYARTWVERIRSLPHACAGDRVSKPCPRRMTAAPVRATLRVR